MGSFDMRVSLHIRQPLLLLLLSISFFLSLDAIIYRTNLYQHYILKYYWSPGAIFQHAYYEAKHHKMVSPDVLLIGNSLLDVAFSSKLFEANYPQAPFHTTKITVSGTNEKVWFYTLKRIDPDHRRYRAIIIPSDGYIINSNSEDKANFYQSALDALTLLEAKDWPSFIASFPDSAIRQRVLLLAFFPSHAYSPDLQDFLMNPRQRLKDLANLRKHHNEMFYDENDVLPTSLDGLKIDYATRSVIAIPDGIEYFRRREIMEGLSTHSPQEASLFTEQNATFKSTWLSKIIDLYKDSPTQIIFIQMPRWPFMLPAKAPLSNAPDIRNMLPKQKNVTFVDEKTFEFLEKPGFFHDTIHLDTEGQKLFVQSFGQILLPLLKISTAQPTH
jgi:hypothetical protein